MDSTWSAIFATPHPILKINAHLKPKLREEQSQGLAILIPSATMKNRQAMFVHLNRD
jgi:hypothetical protein